MGKLYLAVYGGADEPVDAKDLSKDAQRFHAERASSSWPFDAGDDPSFFYAARHGACPITWGVCRPDVRRGLQLDDWVVFFSVRYDGSHEGAEYRFAAALRVQQKLTQADIHRVRRHARFRKYPNLLIRPCGAGWEQFEPVLPNNKWHKDWLWRICVPSGLRKHEFMAATNAHQAGSPLRVSKRPAPLATNYVVFGSDPNHGIVASAPPLVALWRRGQDREQWCSTPGAKSIRELTLGMLKTARGLRTCNRQPHRHVVGEFERPSAEWLSSLRTAVTMASKAV